MMQDVQVKLSPGLPWQRHHSKRRKPFHQQTGLKFKEEKATCYIWSISFYRDENWTLLKVHQKYLESFNKWCWRRMEKISWTNRVRNENVLPRVKEERGIIHAIEGRKANWSGHIVRTDCVLKHIIE
jgi:hypothetical protein